MKEKRKVILSLGSNIPDRKQYLEKAIVELEKVFETQVVRSRIYETAPWGFESEVPFLNCCVSFYSSCIPTDLLFVTKRIEKDLGRVKKSQKNEYQSRVIDIDILYVGELIVRTDELTLPHPQLYDRSFVLTPLIEICPAFVDPVKKQNITAILESCNDKNSVILYEN